MARANARFDLKLVPLPISDHHLSLAEKQAAWQRSFGLLPLPGLGIGSPAARDGCRPALKSWSIAGWLACQYSCNGDDGLIMLSTKRARGLHAKALRVVELQAPSRVGDFVQIASFRSDCECPQPRLDVGHIKSPRLEHLDHLRVDEQRRALQAPAIDTNYLASSR